MYEQPLVNCFKRPDISRVLAKISSRKLPSSRGFTLIEVLVAISITAIIGAGAALTLQSGVKTREALEARAEILQELQKFQRTMASDLRQIVNRTVRNEFGDKLYACTNLNALTLLEFSRTGWRDPATFLASLNAESDIKPRSSLQRIVYELEEGTLYRYYWRVMDRAQDSEPVRQKVIDQVLNLELRFLDEKNEWSDQWPTASALSNEDLDAMTILPKAIEMTVEHETFGEFSKLHLVAGWNAHKIRPPVLNNANNQTSNRNNRQNSQPAPEANNSANEDQAGQ